MEKIINNSYRTKLKPEINSYKEGLKLAENYLKSGKFNEAFDVYEALLDLDNTDKFELLSIIYESFRSFPLQDRYNLYQRRVFNFGIKEGDKVLDIGSGNVPFPLATHLADITIEDNTYGRAGVPFKFLENKPVYEINIEDMPFEDNEFDFVYCSHVLEHVDNPEKACKELMRVGKRGYIETPSYHKDLIFNTAEVSNHKWKVSFSNNTLEFSNYENDELKGIGVDVFREMSLNPASDREKAFYSLIHLRPELFNTMLIWEEKFNVKVNNHLVKIESENKVDLNFIIIVLNGMPFIKYLLKSIYKYAKRIVVIEGAVENCKFAADENGNSIDGTIEAIREFNDHEDKLVFVQGLWEEKLHMQNKGLEFIDDGYVWLVDSDEFYKDTDIEKVIDLLSKDNSITQLNFISNFNFWKGFDYYFTSPEFFKPIHHYRRIFKYQKGSYFTSHRPPTLLYPQENRTTDEINLIDGFQTYSLGINLYHYSYVFKEQVEQKIKLYNKYGWGEGWNLDLINWYNNFYLAWTPENRELLEKEYPIWTGSKESFSVRFLGDHPLEINNLRKEIKIEDANITEEYMANCELNFNDRSLNIPDQFLVSEIIGDTKYQQKVLIAWSYIQTDAPIDKRKKWMRYNIQNNIPFWNIHVALTYTALKLKPENYLEVGVRIGGSMVQVLNAWIPPKITAVDIWSGEYASLPNTIEFTQKQLNKFLESTQKMTSIEYIHGDSHDVLKNLIAQGRKYKLITIDGDHTLEGAEEDLEDAVKLLDSSGAIVFDDITHPSHKYLLDLSIQFADKHNLQIVINTHQDNGCAIFLKNIDLWDFLKPEEEEKQVKKLKVAEEESKGEDLTEISENSTFSKVITEVITNYKPKKIIETGTYLGTGTTKIIASALKSLNINSTFYSIEVNPQNYANAKVNLTSANLIDKVNLLNGLSMPKELLPDKDTLNKTTVTSVEFSDVFIDHPENERVDKYFNETNFPYLPDNLLDKCLLEFEYKPEFVILDSGGHIGFIEFNYVINKIKSDCIIALDDIYHIKHHKSYLFIKQDNRFEILYESKEKFGFCIAKFTPGITLNNNIELKNNFLSQKKINKCSMIILRTDSIGDSIIFTAFLESFHHVYPNISLNVLCQTHIAPLYESIPYIERVFNFDKEKLYSDEEYFNTCIDIINDENFEWLLNPVYSSEEITNRIISKINVPQKIAFEGDLSNITLESKIKYSKEDFILIKTSERSELEKYKDLLKYFSVNVKSLSPKINLNKELVDWANQFFSDNKLNNETTVALFAGAQFNVRHYQSYGKAIAKVLKNYSILVLGDINDKEINGINIQSLNNNFIDLTGKISFMQSLTLLNNCKIAIGSETSLAHAACALGVKNVIIFGGGHFGRFMPYSDLTSVVCLPLKCYGCNWQCKYNEVKCIVDIEEETLAKAITETLLINSSKPRIYIQNYAIPDNYLKQWINNFLNIEEVEIIETVNNSDNLFEKINGKEIIQNNPNYINELINIIEKEISNNNLNTALELIYNGLEDDPDNLYLNNNLAVIHILQKRWNEATETLRKILQLDPENEIALENSRYLKKEKLLYEALLEAESLIEQNNLMESKEILHKILEIEPEYIDALIDLSVIETNLNNYNSAINILENVLKIDSKNEIALENLKMVVESKRNYYVYSERKQLSVVFQGRNDGYMGNFEWRISTSINQICSIINKHGFENEVQVILVDWGSKTPLIESIDLSYEAYNILEVISVPENTASKYNRDSEYSMVHAINTGIRRAAGQYIMFCDGDTFIQEKTLNELLLSLRNGFINNKDTKSNVFLASRYHIPKVFQSNKPSLDQVNNYIEIHKDKLDHDKINLEKFMGTATAYLMHRDIWFELTGFDENLIYWGWFDIDLFYRVKSKYQIYDLEDFGLTFFHLEHYSNSKNRDMLKENPRKINESKMPKLFSPNEIKWGLENEELILKKFQKSRIIDLSKSEINNIIPPEIKNDEFYQEIMKISQQSDISTVLEIGSSAGAGSTEAFVKGLKRNKNKVSLFCMEISKNRFKELEKRYNNYEFVKCYNVSSVDLYDFPSENKVVDFYNNINTSLNKYPLNEVIRWLKQDIEYVQDSDVPRNGIDVIREQNNIQNFDLVLIDGSEFTGIAELVKVYGAKYILLDDINAFKNYESYKFLEKDTNYQLIKENWKIRNGYAIFKFNEDKLPIHIFTLVLNGEPFIEYHLELFKQLPFKWHWHIIEGVAELKNDTAWSVANGGKIADSFHKNGLSIDGTTEYLDKIKKEYPDKITIYRKKDGFWNGKIEMVNAPLRNIKENCILLEVDSDELWTFEQIITLRKLFIENPTKTAAYFWCHFYVGETIITTLKNNYSKSPSYEWIRAWNYRPGDQWLTHEPPALCRKFENNNWNDLAKVNPFYHNETESHGLIFHHYAYVLEEQLKFKEIYYGYKNALSYWQNLNSQKKYPVKLRKFFPWVSDNQEVDEINKFGIKSIAYKSANIWKYNYYIPNENSNIILDNNFQLQNNIDRKKASKKIIIDGVIFQLQRHKPAGISRVWISLLSELGKTDLAESIIILDRDRTAPIITGITNVPVSGFLGYEKIEADSIYLQDICDKYNAGIFISTYYTYPKSTKTIMMVHDLIPEVYEWKGIEWDTKKKCIELADSFLSVSKSTAKDLKRYYQLGKKEINIIPNAVSDIFKENTKEQIDFFKIKYGIKKPYFIVSGTRTYHKNIIQFVKAFNSLKNKNNFEILFTGGPPDIEKEFLPYLKNVKYQVVYLSDKELSVAYSAAVALVYPSKYEGFGLPILEAMKAGCPVITCKNSSLSEVAEEAAIYIKEDDIGSLTLALKSVQSKQNRSKLIKKGFEQAKKFNWSISASKLYEVLSKELIKDKNKIKIRDTKLDEHNSLYYSILSQYELSTALNGLFNLLNTNESLSEKDLYAAEDNLVRAFDDSSILNKLYAVAEKYQDPLLLYIKSLFLEREKEINDTYKCLVSLIKNGFPNWWIVYKVALLANKFNNSKEAIRLLKLVKETKPNIEFIDYKLSEVESATENVKVTAIVSTYNSSKFIKGCLEDLVNQTLYKKDELEIIIINSGSEENEEEIVNEFIKNHKNIRYYKTEKESIYKAWNRAIKLAKGKYITNANTDDRHRNDALEKMLSVFENDETVDIVYANSLKTVTPNDLFHSQTPKSEIKWSQFDKDLILFGCFIGPHPMWKMDLHKRFGLFSEELDVVGDYEFWLRISRESKFHHINEALGLYYYNNKSAEHRNQSLTNDENTDVQKIYLSKYIQSFEDVNRIEKKILQLVNNNKENEYYKIVSELLTFRKEELYHENKFFAEIEKLIKSESIESKSLMFPLQSITKNYKGLLRNEKLNFLIDLFTTLEDTNFEINENVQKLLIENNDFYHNTFIKEFIKSKVRNENRESLNDALEIISNHINEKEYEKSIEYLNNLLNSVNNLSDEYRAELIDMIGNIYLVQGNIEQANKFFEKELQINPSSSRACFGLAETFYIAELYEQAKAMYEWAIKNGKNDEITWNKLRIVNKELNLDENDNSLDLVNIQELLQRAEEFINNDDFENALDILDKILGTDENNIDALNDLSVIFILQNEIESALNVINKVIDLDSENEIAKNNLQVLENKIKASAVN